jgi:hypothetical protein
MQNLDPPYDPGGRSWRSRLSGLCRSLEDLAHRLREGVSRVVSQAVADAVQDTVRELWGRLVTTPAPAPAPQPSRWDRPSWNDAHDEPEGWHRFGQDQEEENLFRPGSRGSSRLVEELDDDPDDDPDEVPDTTRKPNSSRWPEALAAGLQATAWWLRRRGRLSMLTAIGVGVTSALTTFVLGPVAVAGVALAGSALALFRVTRFAGKIGSFPAFD